jgi:hypothetical protein
MSLPSPQSRSQSKAYELLLKKENRIKPASVTNRNNILREQHRINYTNEFQRLQGELVPYINKFGPGVFNKRIVDRQRELKDLLKGLHQTK